MKLWHSDLVIVTAFHVVSVKLVRLICFDWNCVLIVQLTLPLVGFVSLAENLYFPSHFHMCILQSSHSFLSLLGHQSIIILINLSLNDSTNIKQNTRIVIYLATNCNHPLIKQIPLFCINLPGNYQRLRIIYLINSVINYCAHEL